MRIMMRIVMMMIMIQESRGHCDLHLGDVLQPEAGVQR